MGAKQAQFAWGDIQGAVVVPPGLRATAHAAGQLAYEQAVAQDFCGDAVVWLPESPWHAACAALFPEDAVRQLGFELSATDEWRVYSTYGTEPHVDGSGPCFVLVLANDGLKFRQGKHAHVTNVGEWYIFDDSRTHTVNDAKNSTSYVFLHHILKVIQ